MDKVLDPLTQDLVVLERKGLMVNGINHHVRLCFITADILGSHTAGVLKKLRTLVRPLTSAVFAC